ncbi:MAG: toxin TcdB middle/N-terminal domain-containing protein [Candidatus Sumerlaeia bacterium]
MNSLLNPYVSLLLVYLMIILPPVSILASGGDYPRGDLNGDCFIDSQDQALLRDFLLGKPYDSRLLSQGDFNLDSRIDAADLVSLINYDGDWDNDGVPDISDDYPQDPDQYDASLSDVSLDTNGDGYAELINDYRVDENAVLPDGSLADSDGDGLSNVEEDSTGWSNGSGGPWFTDSLMKDTDRDGLDDFQEKASDTNPFNPDTDGDGVLDGDDPDPLNPKIFTPSRPLLNQDGTIREPRRLTPRQIAINNAWQAEMEKKRAARFASAAGPFFEGSANSNRGLGFQGPEDIGSNFDSVQSDKFTGSFSYTIPIKLPPGRAGFQPNLTLCYRSSNGHSWLGQGWDLNPGRIERATRDGVPKYDNPSDPPDHDGDALTPLDNPDRYLYKTGLGGMELVFTGTEEIDGETCGIYHAEIDSGSFTRFIHHPDSANPGGGSWEAWWKDGRKAWFGQDVVSADSVIAGPEGSVFSWGIDRETDFNGNTIEYRYQHPAGAGNMCLESIGYNFAGGEPMVEITFDLASRSEGNQQWASYRESWRSGFKLVSDHFLTTITQTVSRREEILPGRPDRVRRYVLDYHELDNLGGRTISCLKSVQEFGESDESFFPPITMDYSLVEKGFSLRQWGLPSSDYTFLAGSGNTGTEIMDLDGDALPDVLRLISNGDSRYVWRVAHNQGTGFQATDWHGSLPLSFWFAFWGIGRGGDMGSRVIDLDGDGFSDLVHLQKTHTGAFVKKKAINTGSVFQESDSGLPSSSEIFIIYTPQSSRGVTVGTNPMDLNGDGYCDFVRLDESRGVREAALNTGHGFVQKTDGLPSDDYTFLASSGNTGCQAMDLNGDGLSDVLRLISNYDDRYVWRVAFNKGNGFDEYDGHGFLPQSFWFAFWGMHRGGDMGTRIMDLNGDGLLDLIHLQKTHASPYYVRLAAINTGAGFVETSDFGLPLSSEPSDLVFIYTSQDGSAQDVGTRIMDINGDGLDDIIRSAEGSAICAAIKEGGAHASAPNLLVKIDNGIGGTVEVEYTPSNKAWMRLRDPESGQLETTSKMPYTMQVVSKITRTGLRPENINPANPQTPGVSSQSYSSLYRYAAGKHLDHEFRGFGKVKEIDAQTGNFSITEFFQDYSRKGRIESVREYVAHRDDYRNGSGDILDPKDEKATLAMEPKIVKQIWYRYRVIISEEDPLYLKTFTDTDTKLGLPDFPKGMTLVTPACSLTKIYEYSGDYDKNPEDLTDDQIIVIAQEQFFDGRGNLTQTTDYGQVKMVSTNFAQPRIDATFTNDTGPSADGSIVKMTRYERQRLGSWMDVVDCTNTAGFYTNKTSGARESQTVKLLEASTTEYDEYNRPILETQCLDAGPDSVIRYGYDDHGNRTDMTDPRGNHMHVDFDPIYLCFPASRTNPMGHTEEYVVDPGYGTLLSLADPNGCVQSAQYDGLGRITSRKDSSENTILSYEYGFFGESSTADIYLPNFIRTTTHYPTGESWSERHYDGLARLWQNLAPGQMGADNPIRLAREYNDRGIVWKVSHPHWCSDAASVRWTYTFLENDNSLKSSGPKEWDHPGLNRPWITREELNQDHDAMTEKIYETPLSIKSINARDVASRQIKDAFGNLVEVWEPNDQGSVDMPGNPGVYAGRATAMGYDALGRLEYVRRSFDPDFPDQDPVTQISWNSLGRMTRMSDSDTGTTLYEYDANGNLVLSVDARDISVSREYDGLDRLVRLVYPDMATSESLEHIYTYDSGEGTYLLGRLASVQSPACLVRYSYDLEGRVTGVSRTINGQTYDVAMDYDYGGRQTAMTYPDGMQLAYYYDPATQKLDAIVDSDSGQAWLSNVDRSAFGTTEVFQLGNGVTRTNLFDWKGRAVHLQTTHYGTPISDLAYTFDRNSNITHLEEMVGDAPRGAMDYEYDQLDRLASAWGTTMSGADAGDSFNPAFRYKYDALGRMTANSRFNNVNSYGDYTQKNEYSTNPESDRPAHGLRGILFTKATEDPVYAHKFTYDAAGNLVRSTNDTAAMPQNDLDRQYTWDALGRLQSVTTSDGTTAFAYDHSKNRVRKTGPAGDTVVYVGNIMEVTAAGVTQHIFAGANRVATIKSDGEKLFYMTDHLRSSMLITDFRGDLVQRMDYEPYGVLLENARSGNPENLRHSYTGQEADSETGLMYYGARYYDPVVGMFISPDLITREKDQPQRFAEPDLFVKPQANPQMFNRFAYCANNPMIYTDDTGEFIVTATLIGIAVGAAIGAGSAAANKGSTEEILIGAGIGAAAGLVGAAAGVVAAPLGGAAAGVIGGSAGGATSGILGGFQSANWQGEGWSQALLKGAIESTAGAITGGAMGFAGTKLGGLLSKKVAWKSALKTELSQPIGRFETLNRAAIRIDQFAQKWQPIIEEGTAQALDLAVGGVSGTPMSFLEKRLIARDQISEAFSNLP